MLLYHSSGEFNSVSCKYYRVFSMKVEGASSFCFDKIHGENFFAFKIIDRIISSLISQINGSSKMSHLFFPLFMVKLRKK